MNEKQNQFGKNDYKVPIMNTEAAVNLVEICLKQHHLPLLNTIERQLLADSWKGLTYQGTAYKLNYSPHYTRYLASQMWKRLSSLFQQRVSKRNLHQVISECELGSYSPVYNSNQYFTIPTYYQPYLHEANISTAIIHDYFQVIGIFGMLTTGKSTLAQGIVRQVYRDFDQIIWHSFAVKKLSFQEWIEQVNVSITGKSFPPHLITTAEKISAFIKVLKQKRCLLVLDQLEQLFLTQTQPGYYEPQYQGYQTLIKALAQEKHQSYLIFTSRDYPAEYSTQLNREPLFKPLHLTGLNGEQTQKIFNRLGLKAKQHLLRHLQTQYEGNPWSLSQAALKINQDYAGNLSYFLQENHLIFDEIAAGFEQEMSRLSVLEKKVMLSLRIISNPCQKRVFFDLETGLSEQEINEGLASLQARSLLKIESGFIIISSLLQNYLKTLKESPTGTIKELTPNTTLIRQYLT